MPIKGGPLKRLADIVEGNKDSIIRNWLGEVKKDPELSAVKMSDSDRTDHVPRLMDEALSRARGVEMTVEDLRVAALHGEIRRKQGYSIPLLIREAKILQTVIGNCVQENLLGVVLSNLIPDMVYITETIETEREASVRAYTKSEKSSVPFKTSRKKRRKRAA